MVKNLPARRETWVQSLGWEDPLEGGMTTHSIILAWSNSMDRGAWRATEHEVADTTGQRSTATGSFVLHPKLQTPDSGRTLNTHESLIISETRSAKKPATFLGVTENTCPADRASVKPMQQHILSREVTRGFSSQKLTLLGDDEDLLTRREGTTVNH